MRQNAVQTLVAAQLTVVDRRLPLYSHLLGQTLYFRTSSCLQTTTIAVLRANRRDTILLQEEPKADIIPNNHRTRIRATRASPRTKVTPSRATNRILARRLSMCNSPHNNNLAAVGVVLAWLECAYVAAPKSSASACSELDFFCKI